MKTQYIVFIFLFFSLVVLGGLLFVVSQNVQMKQKNIQIVEGSVDKELSAVRVLKAEWGYLNRPDRLERVLKTGHFEYGEGHGVSSTVGSFYSLRSDIVRPQIKPVSHSPAPVHVPAQRKTNERAFDGILKDLGEVQ